MSKFTEIHKQINSFILDCLFPIQCLGCNKAGIWICDPCLTKLGLKNEQVCPVCEKMLTPWGQTCHSCKSKNHLDGLVCASSYQNTLLVQAVHLFKYRFIAELHEPLGNLMIRALSSCELPIPQTIIPIPLHPRRLRWRDFNQALLLSKQVAKNLIPGAKIEVASNILFRTRYTSSQMQIKDFKLRRKNIENAFAVQNAQIIQNKTILLIDDIATTGSTIFECARVLKEAGASEVYAAVIARQEIAK